MEILNTQPNTPCNILITGISGFLGQFLLNSFSSENIIGVYFKNKVTIQNGVSIKIDLTDDESVSGIFNNYKIDYVIHAAALTDLDLCEADEETSMLSNLIITKNIIANCLKYDSKLIYISTDAVFSGAKVTYDESDVPDPISVYGMHKHLSEKTIVSTLSNYIICRFSKLFGDGYGNVFSYIMDGIKNNSEIALYSDIFRNPLSGLAASSIIFKLMKNGQGVYHIGGAEQISWQKFGEYVCDCFGLPHSNIKVVANPINSISAIRPRKLFLQSNRLSEHGIFVPSLKDQIMDIFNFHKLI